VHHQLPLPLGTDVVPRFDNFARGSNGLIVDLLSGLSDIENGKSDDIKQVYVWGVEHSGKSHLLTALHRQALSLHQQSFHASLGSATINSQMLEALDGYDLILLDDVDHVASDREWEMALFNLINFVRERNGKIVFSASAPPTDENWSLPDLVSRFTWGPVLRLEALNESEIRDAMVMSAEHRGMKLDMEAVDFLLKRYRRDVSSLLAAIDVLDVESLAAGRARITIPFLKRCFVFD